MKTAREIILDYMKKKMTEFAKKAIANGDSPETINKNAAEFGKNILVLHPRWKDLNPSDHAFIAAEFTKMGEDAIGIKQNNNTSMN